MTAIVLAGGLLCDARLWAGVQRCAGGSQHIITFDHETSLADMAKSILDLSTPRFMLVGFSMGGMAALLAAAASPERITSLLLVGTHAERDSEDRKINRARQIAVVARDGLAQFVKTELLPAYFGTEQSRHSHAPLVESMAQACGSQRFARHVQALSLRPDPTAVLHRLTMAVTVVSGAEDRVARPEWGQAMAERLPSATFQALPGCGHMVPLECPSELAAFIGNSA